MSEKDGEIKDSMYEGLESLREAAIATMENARSLARNESDIGKREQWGDVIDSLREAVHYIVQAQDRLDLI